jgi:hypothetical protein
MSLVTTDAQFARRQVENCGEMMIELTAPAAARDLGDYLVRCGCTVRFVGDCTLEVGLPVRSDAQARMIEMQAYLRVWQAMHPTHEVKRVDDAGSSSSA